MANDGVRPSWNPQLAKIMVDDIRIANDVRSDSWAVYSWQDEPVFGVSTYTLLSISDDSNFTFAVDASELPMNVLEELQPRSQNRDLRSDGIVHYSLDIGTLNRLSEVLLPAHQAIVRKEATSKSRRWPWHRLDFIEQLEATTGEDLPEPSYLEELEQRIAGQSAAQGNGSGDDVHLNIEVIPRGISNHFASQGLTYSGTQIAEFYTALQTKGFVVLSGISGTGKSKIAQHFTELLPDGVRRPSTAISSPDDNLIAWSTLKPYNTKHNRVVIPAKDEILFPPLQMRQSEQVTLQLDGETFGGRIYQDRMLELSWRKNLTNVLTDQPLNTSIGYKPVYLNERQDIRDLDYIEVIIGAPSFAETVPTEPVSNSLFLSVRPDWRDGTSLLGYYNPLTQTYEWTDFLRFILNAVDNMNSDNPVAWFVILDEMNLAHVEYYFADLLSVLESGRDSRGFTTEPIRLTYPDTVVNDTPPTEIHLPPNLYIIGTVNMDETTHAFSPKVLDRAFTMELSDVDFLGYKPGIIADAPELSASAQDAMLAAFTINGWPTIDKARIGQYIEHHPEIRIALHELNTQLTRHRFHFGYRVFDEVVQFLANAEANTMFASVEDAFDSAVFMKILPKFSGSEGRVGAPLQILYDWARTPFGDGTPPLRRTLDRVTFMLKRLEEDGFVTAF